MVAAAVVPHRILSVVVLLATSISFSFLFVVIETVGVNFHRE